MSDEEVIRVLADRVGWRNVDWRKRKFRPPQLTGYEPGSAAVNTVELPTYLKSRDALAPLLAGLSRQEWIDLGTNLQVGYSSLIDSEGDLKFLLTIPPKDLAHAIAEAIVEQKHEKGAGV